MSENKPWTQNLQMPQGSTNDAIPLIEQRLLSNPFNQRFGSNNQKGRVDFNALINSPMIETFLGLNTTGSGVGSTGYSDGSPSLFTVAVHEGNTDNTNFAIFAVSEDIGFGVYLYGKSGQYNSGSLGSGAALHPLTIGSDYWLANSTDTQILKNGTSTTISGTGRFGPIGHDPTNAYLLVLYSTTKIAKFSGISGTTITNANSDVTLDTAVSQIGFVYDDVNKQYVCVDTTNNLLRKFNSQGKTQSIARYTISDSSVLGLFLIGNRYYLASVKIEGVTNVGANINVSLIPTTMERG